jgi:AP2 domain
MRIILEEGSQYGLWTVVRFDCVDSKRRRRYICRCQCGYETSKVASVIADGKSKKCDFCRASKLEGQQFHDWLVISRLPNRNGGGLWLCRCKCGNERQVSASNLRSGSSKCCFECGHNKTVETSVIPSSWWYSTMDQAKVRNHVWDIDEEYALDVLVKQNYRCALTGITLRFTPRNASLDRIDSRLGYCKGNVQWVHKHINMMKYKYSQDYFVRMCNLVANNFRRKNKPKKRRTNKTGVEGVWWDKRSQLYVAAISMDDGIEKQLRITIGYFKTLEEAAAIRKQAEQLKADGIREKEKYLELAPQRKNNTSGMDGVSKSGNKWRSQIQVNKKKIHLGSFSTKEEAAEAVKNAKKDKTLSLVSGVLGVTMGVLFILNILL